MFPWMGVDGIDMANSISTVSRDCDSSTQAPDNPPIHSDRRRQQVQEPLPRFPASRLSSSTPNYLYIELDYGVDGELRL